MGRFILRRVVLLLPTLFLVMMLAFFLSKMVPGDAAESLMTLQGVQPDASNAPQEYQKHYQKLHLDLPLFYFSVVPDFYPDNINAIISSTERHEIKTLLLQKTPITEVREYLEAKKTAIQQLVNWSETQDSLTKLKHLTLLSTLAYTTDVDEIQELWAQVFSSQIEEIDLTTIKVASDNLSTKRVTWYIPTFRWFGLQNQFHHWISAIIKGQFGVSIKDGRQVSSKILSALKWTVLLSLMNLVFSSLISIPSGMIAGYWTDKLFDRVFGFVWLALYSIPVFWLASVLIVYGTSNRYGTWFNIFPTPGTWYIPDGQNFWTTLGQYSHQMILPVICLVANDIAQLSRIIRNNVISQKSKLYVLMAKAKGAGDIKVLTKHIFPNVLLPFITVIGGKLPAGLSGALIIEVIFNIPGMGRLMYESIYNADWNVVFGILLVVSFVTMVAMLITDILYAIANPKIKTSIK